jgi:hypothetical protein
LLPLFWRLLVDLSLLCFEPLFAVDLPELLLLSLPLPPEPLWEPGEK